MIETEFWFLQILVWVIYFCKAIHHTHTQPFMSLYIHCNFLDNRSFTTYRR